MLGSELWEDNLSSMLDLFMEYVVNIWKLKKARLYEENLSVPQSLSQKSSGELGGCWWLRSHSDKIVVKHSQRAKLMERAHYWPLEFQKKKTMQ